MFYVNITLDWAELDIRPTSHNPPQTNEYIHLQTPALIR